MLGVRLSKYQQIHPDIASAAQQMLTSLFTYLLESLTDTRVFPGMAWGGRWQWEGAWGDGDGEGVGVVGGEGGWGGGGGSGEGETGRGQRLVG